MSTRSLNEIQVYGLRAARGTGMSWGLAEEAGSAARWLAARGLPGVPALAGLLAHNDGRPYQDLAPRAAGMWRARSGALCPVCTGAAIADRLNALVEHPLVLADVSYPLLLLPFLAGHAKGECPLIVGWDGLSVVIDARGHRINPGGAGTLSAQAASRVRVGQGTAQDAPEPVSPVAGEVDVPDDAWRILQSLALRTYVPATEASREKGAGSRLDDND